MSSMVYIAGLILMYLPAYLVARRLPVRERPMTTHDGSATGGSASSLRLTPAILGWSLVSAALMVAVSALPRYR